MPLELLPTPFTVAEAVWVVEMPPGFVTWMVTSRTIMFPVETVVLAATSLTVPVSHIEILGVVRREGDRELHHVGIADGGHLLSGVDLVPHLHIQGVDSPSHVGGDRQVIQALQGAVVVALGLADGDLGLLQGVFCVGGVDGVEDRVLFHLVSLLKVGGEDGPLQQGGDRVGVGRLQGPAAGDGGGDGPPLHSGGGVGRVGGGRSVVPAAQEVPCPSSGDGAHQH